ncbi:MAG TPA: S8 family serine peptidase [Streptosporangiaceae bacterium]|nr:S8 family serine peptidase [Streptosporangiaceae bacterium]
MILTTAIGLAVAWAALGIGAASADQVRQGEWWLGALHVTQAQQATQGAGVTIALLDTGVDPAQPDLAGSVIPGPDFTNSGEKLGTQFYGIHGTAMASLIVGHGHGQGDADGVLGVAPAAKLLSVRVALDAGDPLLDESSAVSVLPGAIADGIRYAVNNGAQVIDLPLDPGQSVNSLVATPTPAPAPNTPLTPLEAAQQTAAGGSAAEQSAVAYALSKGVVLVAPGGDNGAGTDDPNFPADYPGVISVGAFDSSFIKAAFSSHQSYVTLTAAGSGMTAGTPAGYTTVSSTSAASAIVTGIAALIKSEYPRLTPTQITQALTTSTVFRPANGMSDGSGHGTADAARALAAAKTIAGPGLSRADAGAVSRAQPGAPSAPFISQALAPKIKRDGLISGAVLVILLLPIIFYALMRRRRRKARLAGRPEHEQIVRAPYAAQSGDSQAEQMLQYFAAVPPQAESSISGPQQPVGAAQQAAAGTAGRGRGNGVASGAFGDGVQQAPEEAARRFLRSPLGQSRRAAARPPKVSGTPPWEPAAKPDTELPWAASPPPALPRRAPVPLPAPSAPAAESLWARAAAGAAAPATENGRADGASEAAEPGIRPIYVWNPGANTETFDTFPSVPSRGPTAQPGEPEPDEPPAEPED